MTSLAAMQHHTCYWGNSGGGGALMPHGGISKILHNEALPKPQGRLRCNWSPTPLMRLGPPSAKRAAWGMNWAGTRRTPLLLGQRDEGPNPLGRIRRVPCVGLKSAGDVSATCHRRPVSTSVFTEKIVYKEKFLSAFAWGERGEIPQSEVPWSGASMVRGFATRIRKGDPVSPYPFRIDHISTAASWIGCPSADP
jgi:hypothetical protein